ncbi:MAG: hypothetical protein V4691_00970 [Pseudomonadota bacterium]
MKPLYFIFTTAIFTASLAAADAGPLRPMAPSKGPHPTTEQLLNLSKPQWITFQDNQETQTIYFNGLLPFSCALKNVYYGLNGEEPKTRFPLPECNKEKAISINSEKDTLFLSKKPGEVTSVKVMVEYADGKKTPVLTYTPCAKAKSKGVCGQLVK